MMKEIALFGAESFPGARDVAGAFFPGCRVTQGEEKAPLQVFCRTCEEEGAFTAQIKISDDEGKKETAEEKITSPFVGKAKQTCLYRALFWALSRYTGRRPPWGILTGVRPAKLLQNMQRDGFSDEAIREVIEKEYLASPEKIELLFSIAKLQKPIVDSFSGKGYSLYISVPFCPSKCSYCSFVSHSVETAGHLIGPYLVKLGEELKEMGALAHEQGLRLDSVYIGGGTPTILSAGQLAGLLDTVQTHFPLSSCREYTVEAGRADTIDLEKLALMRRLGVNRISINPQTMNQKTLLAIGRRHTPEEVAEAFSSARAAGFDNINMDLIAGLPGETAGMFAYTLDEVLKLDPESITVHTLSLKRGSKLKEWAREGKEEAQEESQAAAMHQLLQKRLRDTFYLPYYLYRQKNMKESLENVGWCKKGKEGVYNIAAMEETETIFAAGAGGVSKIVDKKGEKIYRIFNFKYPYEYNRQIGGTSAVVALGDFYLKKSE